jgi:hypothetical protein
MRYAFASFFILRIFSKHTFHVPKACLSHLKGIPFGLQEMAYDGTKLITLLNKVNNIVSSNVCFL